MPLSINERIVSSFLVSNGHNHEADLGYCQEMLLRHRILQRCRETGIDSKIVFEDECRQFPLEISSRLSFESLRRTMYRQRRENTDSIPPTLSNLSEKLANEQNQRFPLTVSGEDFYLGSVQDEVHGTSVVFGSPTLIRKLHNATEIHVDGTFKVRPNVPPSRLLTVMAVLYNRAMSRKARGLGLTQAMNENSVIKKAVKMTMALALLPANRMAEGIASIDYVTEQNLGNILNQYLQYVRSTWIEENPYYRRYRTLPTTYRPDDFLPEEFIETQQNELAEALSIGPAEEPTFEAGENQISCTVCLENAATRMAVRCGHYVVCRMCLAGFVSQKKFMSKFGYLETGDSASESLVRVELAIKDVQRFGNIAQTGQLDNATVQLMKSPRCGLPDILSSRHKRYVLAPTMGWKRRTITYYISNWSPQIGHDAVRTELRQAFTAWAKYGRLRFQESSSPDADIIVAFGTNWHGDSYPFDGPGLTLAHAFFPGEHGSFGGDIHFDEDETWKIRPGELEDGVDFFTVAVHEIGHSLGLAHSDLSGSVMNPYYKHFDSRNFNLGYDDILAMYELYITKPVEGGNESWDEDDEMTRRTTNRPRTSTTTTRRPERTTPRTTSRPEVDVTFVGDVETVDMHKTHDPTHNIPDPVAPLTPEPTDTFSPRPPQMTTPSMGPPDACQGHFSTVANIRGELFVFKDQYIWRLTSPGRLMPGYPATIHRMFHRLPQTIQRIDAAYERSSDNNIIFFSGDKYWIHNGNDIVDSPKPLSDYGLPNYVKKIDAIMVWARNKKTYIFSGNEFWRFNDTTHTMDPGYPKTVKLFQGVPPYLDSAMTWTDGITYFFKDNLYWAFNNTWLRTEAYYPQEASQYWLGCR